MVKPRRFLKSEAALTDSLRRLAAVPRGSALVAGIGDDCAIFRPPNSREDLLFTTDLLVEDTHFRRATHRAADIGWKALARGLLDCAGMGGAPCFCLPFACPRISRYSRRKASSKTSSMKRPSAGCNG